MYLKSCWWVLSWEVVLVDNDDGEVITIIIIIIIIMDNLWTVLFFIRNELTVLGRVVSIEACCQWVLVSVQITRLVTLPQQLFPLLQCLLPNSSAHSPQPGCTRLGKRHWPKWAPSVCLVLTYHAPSAGLVSLPSSTMLAIFRRHHIWLCISAWTECQCFLNYTVIICNL